MRKDFGARGRDFSVLEDSRCNENLPDGSTISGRGLRFSVASGFNLWVVIFV